MYKIIVVLWTFFPPPVHPKSYFIYHLCGYYLRRSCSQSICRPLVHHSPPSLDHSPPSVNQSLSCLPRRATWCVVCTSPQRYILRTSTFVIAMVCAAKYLKKYSLLQSCLCSLVNICLWYETVRKVLYLPLVITYFFTKSCFILVILLHVNCL